MKLGCCGLAAVLCAGSLFACGEPQRQDHEKSIGALRLVTGPATGSFGPLGRALVRAFAEHSAQLRLVAQETAGSVPNIQALQQGTADLGLAQAGAVYMAYHGQLPGAKQSFHDFLGVAVLHPSYVHLLVAPGARITSIAALKGKRVGVGPVGTNGAVTSIIARGLYAADDLEIRNVAVDKTAEALGERALDAVFITSGIPSDEISRAMVSGARLLDIEGAAVDRLRIDYPFLKAGIIPPNSYRGQTSSVHTLAVDVVLAARADLDAAVVRRVTATLFDVLPRLSRELRFLRSMEIERASATPIPLHPGAALYYREKELGR
jgi:TRAP transporter TAXI family solute receptor